MKRTLAILLLSIVPLLLGAEPFSLVSGRKAARLVVHTVEPEYVVLAANDLSSDVYRITGRQLQVIRAKKARKGDVFIRTVVDGRWEAYGASVGNGVLNIVGSDARGTMFAVYDFIEHYLGIDPMSWWNQAEIPSKAELVWDDVRIVQDEPSFRFRGWFINDEDLLTAWKPSSGDRFVIYPYYSTVMNHEIMEHIAESLVRSRFNLIIPSSLVYQANPAEAALADICARRGVFLSMHHVEPLGVSAFSFFKYWKDRGREIPFSYWSNPEEIEQVWKETAAMWAKYPNVIWQIGLRGVGDRPIWLADSAIPPSDEQRAAIISSAMARQLEILDEIGVPKEGRLVTTTLWAEGALFQQKGYLKIPEGTKIIFADNSPGWIWQEDFYSTQRRPEYTYGVYYHPALIDSGPHLASLVPASKMYSRLKEARDSGAGDYAMINVSNVREFTYNIAALESMLWDMDSYEPEKWTEQWVERHYSENARRWLSAYNVHYNAVQENPATGVPSFLDGLLCSRADSVFSDIRRMVESGRIVPDDEPFSVGYAARDDKDAFWKSIASFQVAKYPSRRVEYASVCTQRAAFELASEMSASLYRSLPEGEKPFALTTLVYPSELMFHMSDWYAEILRMRESFCLGDRGAAEMHRVKALSAIGAACGLESVYCTGRFDGWWNDCRKIDLRGYCRKTEEIKELIR